MMIHPDPQETWPDTYPSPPRCLCDMLDGVLGTTVLYEAYSGWDTPAQRPYTIVAWQASRTQGGEPFVQLTLQPLDTLKDAFQNRFLMRRLDEVAKQQPAPWPQQ